MKKALEKIICLLVKYPQEVSIEENNNSFNVKTHPQDVKFVIGKNGRTIKALKELLRIKGENISLSIPEIKINQK